MLLISLLLSFCIAKTTFLTRMDYKATNEDFTCRREDGSILYRAISSSFTVGYKFKLFEEPAGKQVVRAKRTFKSSLKNIFMQRYEIEYISGDEWRTALVIANHFHNLHRWRSLDINLKNENFTAEKGNHDWQYLITSKTDKIVVADIVLKDDGFSNTRRYITTVDETRMEPALVSSLLAIVEKANTNRDRWGLGGIAAGGAGTLVAMVPAVRAAVARI
jgi:hypothetical protein